MCFPVWVVGSSQTGGGNEIVLAVDVVVEHIELKHTWRYLQGAGEEDGVNGAK